jgi:hypothetical protein
MEDNIAKNYYSYPDTTDLPMQRYTYTYDSVQTLLFAEYVEVQPPALWLWWDAAATDSYRKKMGVPDDDDWQSRLRTMSMLHKWNAFGYLNETFATADVNSAMFKIRLSLSLSSRYILREHIAVLNSRRKGTAGMNAFRRLYRSSLLRKPDSTDLNFFTVADTIYESLPCYLLKRKETTKEAKANEVYIVNKNDYALLYYSRTGKNDYGFSMEVATYAKVGNTYRNIQLTSNGFGFNPLFDKHERVYGYTKERLWLDAPPLDSANNKDVDIVKQPNSLMLEEWNRFIGSKAE